MLKLSVLILVNLALLAHNSVIPSNYEKSPEEGDLFEGDILGVERGAAQKPTSSRLKWPNGVVPYIIDSVYTQSQKDTILAGLKLVEDSTRINGRDCIKFVPRTSQGTYIRVISDTGCYSYVGMQSNSGEQILSLKIGNPGCLVTGIVAHEFIHALGFWHEQSRPDRDSYIKVLYENIQTGTESNFNKYDASRVDLLDIPYDYDSVMHYGPTSFSKNGLPTIQTLQSGVTIGQRVRLSTTDILELRRFYNCI